MVTLIESPTLLGLLPAEACPSVNMVVQCKHKELGVPSEKSG